MDSATEPLVAVVVNDDPFALEALCQMLDRAEIHAIPAHGSDEECLDVIERNRPSVMITDLHSSDDVDSATSLVRRARAVSPTTACLVLVTSDPTGALLSGALLAGVQGCIRKGAVPPLGLPTLVRRLAAGEYVIDPLMAASPQWRITSSPRSRSLAAHSIHHAGFGRRGLPPHDRHATSDQSSSWYGTVTHIQEERAPWPTRNTLG